MFKPKSILVPTDFSECSEFAFKQAVEIANHFQASITLIHVESADIERMSAIYIDKEKMQEIKENLKKEIEENMKEMIKNTELANKININMLLAKGVAYDEIVRLSKTNKYDLIVISSHGKNALETFFYGSTTEKVVRNAKCSVLVVRK
jgi:nucleotide-binding universal stress UspA family protein